MQNLWDNHEWTAAALINVFCYYFIWNLLIFWSIFFDCDCDQQHKVQLEASLCWRSPEADSGASAVNICINNVSDERVQLQQIAGGAKPGGVVDTPEGCGGSGDTFLRTWKAGGRTGPAWASRSSWHEEPNPSSRMGWGLTSWTERHLCMLVDTRWNRRQWGVASEASSLLSCIRSVASSWKGGPSSLLSTDKATSLGSPVQER